MTVRLLTISPPRFRLKAMVALLSTIAACLALSGTANAAQLSYSTDASRANAVPLQGSSLTSGNVYIFGVQENGLRQVIFYLDPPASGSVAPYRTENIAPFDFAGTASSGAALAFNAATLTTGTHSVKAVFNYQNTPSQTLVATFTVGTPPPPPPVTYTLQLSSNAARSSPVALSGSNLTSSPAYIFIAPATNASRVDFYLDGATAPTSSDTLAPMDFAQTAADGTAIAWNPTSVAAGSHTIRAVVTSTGGATQTVTSTFTVASGGSGTSGDRCAPVVCAEIRVNLPFELEFGGDAGHLLDGLGVGTGFTYVLPASKAVSYTRPNLFVDSAQSELGIQTTAGIANTSINTHTNMVGVGFTGQAQTARISTRIVAPPDGTGQFEQAGLWFGYDQDNFLKLVYESTSSGNVIEFVYEQGAGIKTSYKVSVPSAAASSVSLDLIVDPYNQQVAAYYAIGGDDLRQIGKQIPVAPELFSFDAAGIDPEIGTRSFAGIFATHRKAATAKTYYFDRFAITATSTAPPTGPITFNRKSYPVSNATSVVWGPDNRLYVLEMRGNIHALTFDGALNVVADQVIPGLVTLNGNRLALGIAIDPASTSGDVRLWVTSSSPSASAGEINSGMVTRLSGPNFTAVQNIITGLPRAISNHAPNSLHFGPDGRLYIAIGGNTGTGSPVDVPNEFGDRPEQWLSAAIVVAPVNAPNFDGTCAPAGIYDRAPCDVVPYATGLRNSYDFVFHSNGQMYATDNGLGVVGAYPPSPFAPCFGVGDSRPWSQGGDNPGTQPDLLHRIEPGRYYGHPNPSRSECVFKNGDYQHVAALPNFASPLAILGDHLSANGITEYRGSAICGAQGSLLIANYSLGQSLSRVTLAPGGNAVQSIATLVSGLSGPLAVTTNPAGDIFVTELNAGMVTALRYSGPACTN
jgi:large repetitive protein